MRTTRTRRLLVGITTAVLAAAATVVSGAAPAHAAASGYLLLKGTGSVYTANDIVNLGAVPGTTKSAGLKVVNNGTSSQQYKVVLNQPPAPATATLLVGSTVVPSPYYTALIAPGRSLALTVKITIPAAATQSEYVASTNVRDPETGTFLDAASIDANVTRQTGSTRHDFFLKTGSQPFVGGSVGQFETANAIKPGGTAAFTLRLKNDGGTPGAITLRSFPPFQCDGDASLVVKQGTTDVTAAVDAGTYTTAALAPGAKVELKASVKLLHATTCTAFYYGFTATGADGSITSYAHVVTGV